MFLLHRGNDSSRTRITEKFTFHYVSITSGAIGPVGPVGPVFTFHYVSITSESVHI